MSDTTAPYPPLRPLLGDLFWYDISPKEASEKFPKGIPKEAAPINDLGAACPWPYDPQQLVGVPLGQYHCPYCDGLAVCGVRHFDDRDHQNKVMA